MLHMRHFTGKANPQAAFRLRRFSSGPVPYLANSVSAEPVSERQRWIALNQFQRMMLRWNELHPYNAVHVVRIPAPLDLERLANAITATFRSLNLGEFDLDGSSPARCAIRNTQYTPNIQQLAPNDASTFYSEIQRQLNTRFPLGPRFHPFRFFVQQDGASFLLGITYFHPIADAESTVWLLKSCVTNYIQRDSASVTTIEMYPQPPGPFLFRHPAVALRRAAVILATATAMRRCFRPPIRNHDDFNNGFVFFSVPAQSLDALIAASKSWSVTVNDLFLALLLKSISPLASCRYSDKRAEIGVGCIVNLRKDLDFGSRPVFGVFLGSFVLTHEAREAQSLETLSRDVHHQTAKIKDQRLALGTPVELVFGRLLFSLFSTERQKKLYQKNYPLWGGVTNMNLNSMWPQEHDPSSSIDYFRAVSTGPATPLVLSTTTCGDHLNIGLTFRTTVYSDSDITRFKTTFLDYINQLRPST